MEDDLRGAGLGAARGGGEGAGTDGDAAGAGALEAVGGGDDGVLVGEGSAAEVTVGVVEGDDEGVLAELGGLTTDDELVVLSQLGGESGGEGRDGEESEGLESHCDDDDDEFPGERMGWKRNW